MGGDFIGMDRYSCCEHSCQDLFFRGMMDGYMNEKMRILRMRRERKDKEEKIKEEEREVGRIVSQLKEGIKEVVNREIKEVTNKWKDIVLEKEETINELKKQLEDERNI